jgi:hypothetical protein
MESTTSAIGDRACTRRFTGKPDARNGRVRFDEAGGGNIYGNVYMRHRSTLPARLKGVEPGYELDPVGNCGKNCKICQKWNERYKMYPQMFREPISEWHVD